MFSCKYVEVLFFSFLEWKEIEKGTVAAYADSEAK